MTGPFSSDASGRRRFRGEPGDDRPDPEAYYRRRSSISLQERPSPGQRCLRRTGLSFNDDSMPEPWKRVRLAPHWTIGGTLTNTNGQIDAKGGNVTVGANVGRRRGSDLQRRSTMGFVDGRCAASRRPSKTQCRRYLCTDPQNNGAAFSGTIAGVLLRWNAQRYA